MRSQGNRDDGAAASAQTLSPTPLRRGGLGAAAGARSRGLRVPTGPDRLLRSLRRGPAAPLPRRSPACAAACGHPARPEPRPGPARALSLRVLTPGPGSSATSPGGPPRLRPEREGVRRKGRARRGGGAGISSGLRAAARADPSGTGSGAPAGASVPAPGRAPAARDGPPSGSAGGGGGSPPYLRARAAHPPRGADPAQAAGLGPSAPGQAAGAGERRARAAGGRLRGHGG